MLLLNLTNRFHLSQHTHTQQIFNYVKIVILYRTESNLDFYLLNNSHIFFVHSSFHAFVYYHNSIKVYSLTLIVFAFKMNRHIDRVCSPRTTHSTTNREIIFYCIVLLRSKPFQSKFCGLIRNKCLVYFD